MLLHIKICHWLLGQLNWVDSSLLEGILTLHSFLLGQEYWGWLQSHCNLLVHIAFLISCLGMAFPLQRSFVGWALLVWVFQKLIRAFGHVLLLSSRRTEHHLRRSQAIKAHETVQVPNTTQMAAWENYVSHRGYWICTNVCSVFLTCLSEPRWCLQQREIFGVVHFPPTLLFTGNRKCFFFPMYLFVLNCNHKGLYFSPFSGDPWVSTCCRFCISSYLSQSCEPFHPFL